MSSLKKHAGILRILAKAKPSVIRAIVRDSDTDLLYLLSVVIYDKHIATICFK